MTAQKNLILLGTSNSIKGGSYFKELLASEHLNIVADVRVGDVPATFFLSAERQIRNVSKLSDIDYIVIDSMINDVLMTESGILDKDYLRITFRLLGNLFGGLSATPPHIILFNICPKAVENAQSFQLVKNCRKSTLLELGLKVSEVDILYSEEPESFPYNDPLHHSTESSAKLCEKLLTVMQVNTEASNISSAGETGTAVEFFTDLSELPILRAKSRLGYFQSSLTVEPACYLSVNEELELDFECPTQLMGIKFISSESRSLLVSISVGNETFYIPASSAYPKPIIRYCPFPSFISNKQIDSVKISVKSKADVGDDANFLRLPNSCLEDTQYENNKFVRVSGFVTNGKRYGSKVDSHLILSKKKLRVAFECFWPGFKPENDPIFGQFMQEYFDVVYTNQTSTADIVFVSWYSPDKARKVKYNELKNSIKGSLVYYTAEHDGAGLKGEEQLDFDIFDHAFSHYNVVNSKHTWLPNYVRRHGINVFSTVNEQYEKNINKLKTANIQFCYSNDACDFRNKLFKALNAKVPVDANGSLYNKTGYKLPRNHRQYIEELSDYRFVIACENSSSPGYNTEKIVHALMAGTVPLYWGDPLIGSIWNEECFVNLHKVNMNSCVEAIAENGEQLFNEFREKQAIPFPNAEEIEEELGKSFLEAINKMSGH